MPMPRKHAATTRPGRFLAKWVGDRRGNFAMIFALALVPALVAIGAAVDASRAYAVRQRLSRALDAAGLAVGTQTGLTTAQMQAMAQSYFNANYPSSANAPTGTVSVAQDGAKINLTVSTDMNTSFMGLVGINKVKVAQSSQITRMGKKLEVVLVLDTTGSMSSSNKMKTMQSAAKDLINTVKGAAVNPGDVKVSIVPFTVDVKVGTSYKNENWIKWVWTTPKYKDDVCTGSGKNKTCRKEDREYNISKNSWKGCVGDRDMNYDVSDSLPLSSNDATKYPADNDDCVTEPILPLTYNWTDLTKKIDDLEPSGNTNTTIGLSWGFHMLTPGAPLSTAAAYDPLKLNKVIVFLTDGENTENRFTTSSSSIDARTQTICNAIKAKGIQIYTIRVINGNSTLIKNCATDASMYYNVTTASQLTTVFGSIAQALSNLRVSK